MLGGAREWNLVNRPSFSGISSLNLISSRSMLLIKSTKSFTSQVSYSNGMIFTVGLGWRARFGEEPCEDEDDFVSVVEDAEAICGSVAGSAARLDGSRGSKAGSGGGINGRGGLGVARRLPAFLAGSGIGADGGEYCVPASTVAFFIGDVDEDAFCAFGITVGERETCRGNAAGGGGLMKERDECEVRK